MRISDNQEPEYESVRISYVGFIDPYSIEGMLILKTLDNKEFCIRAFSGEIAQYIINSINGDLAIPTIYEIIGELCEQNESFLVKVKIYENGFSLRANLYYTGKKNMILRNYRASDAIALSVLYKAPILIRKNLLNENKC